MSQDRESRPQDIAVIGMAGRFPGAPDLDAYWRIIEEGRDAITRGTDLDATIPSGPGTPLPENFVAARGVLAGVEDFDPGFWGYTPREAATLDPQHRLWLELAHETLESAGYARPGHGQVISVFAGSFLSSYLHGHLLPTRVALEEFLRLQGAPSFALMVQNDPAFLPSRSAYKLNLRGPAVNVQTGCSTSLVAIAQGVQSLLSFESDIALAGGVCIALPQHSGYFYQEGAITARDGYCRPYDAKACGTVFGSGGGAVALKRLAEAERDGDPIHAVIRGVALNNDGVAKVSFHAPSVAGQAQVITMAQTLAEVEPDTIGYVEGHGTATPMGDPIEVEALTQAFRRKTKASEFCCLGSAKGNVGHLDAAAGVAGFIRTVLALRRQVLPPTAHFASPNPNLRLPGSPFFVLSSARPWAPASHPRRAGVSSFGIGGTNAHVVLEEYPRFPEPAPSMNGPIELRLSAKQPAALDAASKRLAEHLRQTPTTSLSSIASTLRLRREAHPNRRSVLASDHSDGALALTSPERWDTGKAFPAPPKLVFAFPGQGSLRLDALGRLVAGDEPFARHLAHLARPASELLSFDVLGFCRQPDAFPDALTTDNARAQTVLYCVCVALARCLGDMGITPDVVLGHSVGEWPAAYLSGQVSAEDGLCAVFHRGRLMSGAGRGAALSVKASEERLESFLLEGVTLACVNGNNLCLLSGRPEAIHAMREVLRGENIPNTSVPIDVAVHSPLMDAAVPPFAEILATLAWHAPSRPMLSSVTGAYFPSDVGENREYFSRQLRAQVRFDRTITALTAEPAVLVVEVGIANTVTALLTAGFSDTARHRAIPLLPIRQIEEMGRGLRRVPGLLWAHGLDDVAEPQAPSFPAAMDLPTYPFQRMRCWIDPPRPSDGPTADSLASTTETSDRQKVGARSRTIADRIADLISTASGLPASSLDPSRTYIELGFDSILLMQLESAIRRELGVKITWRELLEDHSTPAKLEAFVRGSNPGLEAAIHESSPHATSATAATSELESTEIQGLTALREAGPRRLFLSYDGEGHVLQYLKLARSMPRDFSLYGLLPLRLPNIPQAHTTVEDMARHCVSIVRKKQPVGPYLVGGLCAGGVIAFEMARQLEAAGDKVDWLVLFESINPQTRYRPFLETRDRLKRFLESSRAARETATPEVASAEAGSRGTNPRPEPAATGKLSRVARKLRNVVVYEVQSQVDTLWTAARIRILRQLMKRDQPWPNWLKPLGELELFTIIKDDYHPATIDADIVLVRATLEAEGLDPPARHYVKDPVFGWGGHTNGKMEIIDSGGGHVNMLLDEPWFGEIADNLARVLSSKG